MTYTALSRARLALAVASLVAITWGCSPLPMQQAPAEPQRVSPPAMRLDSAGLNALISSQSGLCTGKDGVVAACSTGPRPRWDVDQIKVPALVDTTQLQATDRPDYVICRIDYQQQPPKWDCAEIYKGTPR